MSDGGSFGPAFNANGGGWLVVTHLFLEMSSNNDDSETRYAMERTNSSIKVWFWSRNSASVPPDVRNSTGSVDTDAWVRLIQIHLFLIYNPLSMSHSQGIPAAFFRSDQCDFASHFGAHNIIINLSFCKCVVLCEYFFRRAVFVFAGGDFAGSAYPSSGCPSTCDNFVNNNPGAFDNAFFDFAAIRVYS